MNIIKRNIDEMHILFGVKTHTKCEKCVFLLNENYCFCEKWGKILSGVKSLRLVDYIRRKMMTKIEAYDELHEIIKRFSPMSEDEIEDTLYKQVTFEDIKDSITMMNNVCIRMKEIVGKVDEDAYE